MTDPPADTEPAPEEAGTSAGDGVTAEDVRDEVTAAKAQAERITELEHHLRRALADLDNLRKRFERELARERSAERARVTKELLPLVDNLERALTHAGATAESLMEGTRAVLDDANAALQRLGYPRFEDTGTPFDPARHEAVATVANGAPPGIVVETVRPGYGTEEELLRPAAVVVARHAD
jgi:molecular chaperone GrpE